MSSRWTHSVCDGCYRIISPDQDPTRLVNPAEATCCLCGDRTSSGIFVRMDPTKTMCKGVHPDDETKKLEARP